MKENSVVYYLIKDKTVGKRENKWNSEYDYLFEYGMWLTDTGNVIRDHLVGFDASEPEESPYRFGNTGIMMEMDEISEEQAMKLINEQIMEILRDRWKETLRTKYEKWNENPMWPAKGVHTSFKLNGIWCGVGPGDLGLTSDGWDQGFMESVHEDIERDLSSWVLGLGGGYEYRCKHS